MAVVRKLEVTLGPDTAELGMRFGLHSGAVTAGVLRGMSYVSDCLYMHHGWPLNYLPSTNYRRTCSVSALWGYRSVLMQALLLGDLKCFSYAAFLSLHFLLMTFQSTPLLEWKAPGIEI